MVSSFKLGTCYFPVFTDCIDGNTGYFGMPEQLKNAKHFMIRYQKYTKDGFTTHQIPDAEDIIRDIIKNDEAFEDSFRLTYDGKVFEFTFLGFTEEKDTVYVNYSLTCPDNPPKCFLAYEEKERDTRSPL